jgi:hypothetical protein
MRGFTFILIAFNVLACADDGTSTLLKKEDIEGRWKVIKQTENGVALKPFSQIYLISDGEVVLDRDTIFFENSIFEFQNGDNYFLNNFNFSFQDEKVLSGLWSFDDDSQSIVVTSKVEVSQSPDTTINGRFYEKNQFVSYLGERKSKFVNQNRITLSVNDEILFLERQK